MTLDEIKTWGRSPKGLFQTNYRVGVIFPIIRRNRVHSLESTPVHNNVTGEIVALDLMKSEDFICWAIDPWTGEINIKIK